MLTACMMHTFDNFEQASCDHGDALQQTHKAIFF